MRFHRWILAAALVPAFAACKERSDAGSLDKAEEYSVKDKGEPGQVSNNTGARGLAWEDDDGPIDRRSPPTFGERGAQGGSAPLARADVDPDREPEGNMRGALGEDPNSGAAGASSIGQHFNQTAHAQTIPESAIQLSAVKGAGGKEVKGSAKVFPRGNGEAQVIVELANAEPGTYAVRLGGECNQEASSEDKAAATASINDDTTAMQLGTLVVGKEGNGKLIATIEHGTLEGSDAEDFDQQALIVTPAKKSQASEPVACGTVSLPDDLGAG